MENKQAKIVVAAKKYYSGRKNVVGMLGILILFHWLPLGIVRLGVNSIPWYGKELVYTVINMFRCCMFCYVADLIHMKDSRRPFRCFAWPRAYMVSFSAAFVHQRIINSLIGLIAILMARSKHEFVGAAIMMVGYSAYFFSTFLFDSYFVKLVLSEGKLHQDQLVKGWIPMMANRIKLEWSVGKYAIIPLAITFVILSFTYSKTSKTDWDLVLFIGQSLLWGYALYYTPMILICRFMHASLNYYEENIYK